MEMRPLSLNSASRLNNTTPQSGQSISQENFKGPNFQVDSASGIALSTSTLGSLLDANKLHFTDLIQVAPLFFREDTI